MEKKKSSKQPKKQEKPVEEIEDGEDEEEEAAAGTVVSGLTEKTEEELVDLTSRVYKLVVERGKDGVLQSEIWKELGLTSRDGSRLAIRLEKRGMIKRVKVLDDGRWTYKLTPLRLPANISSMESAPCIVCPVESKCSVTTEVNPFTCPLIGPWVIKEHRDSELLIPQAPQVA